MRAAVLFADGCEEIEAITPVDLLRRAGIEVLMVGVTGKDIEGGHGIRITTDMTVDEIDQDLDAVLVPGGLGGADNLSQSAAGNALIQKLFKAGKLVASICASPARVLHPLGILEGKRFTCFPGFEEGLEGGQFSEDRVVVDGSLITSRGAGTAAEWSVAVISYLVGEEKAMEVHRRTLQKD